MYKNLSLLLPAKNEKACIDKVFGELEKINFNSQILLVVDSPKDNTLNYKKKKYKFKINKIITNKKGYGSAIIEGIKKCKTQKICIFNADGSFDPRSLKEMLKQSKKFNHVFCSRYLKNAGSDDDTFLTFIGNKIFTLSGKFFFNINLNDILYAYYLSDIKKIDKLKLKQKDFTVALEVPLKIENLKQTYTEIPSKERKRISGKKKVREFVDGFKLLRYMINFYLNYIFFKNT
jgi:glycosyltransferase involved in cell wall biosynthesis